MSETLAMILGSGGGGGGGGFLSFGILLLIPFAMYFFMIRPQRRRVKEQQQLQRSISIGDEVVTTSGIVGKITGEDGDTRFWLEIDDDVQIRIARAAIQGRSDDAEDAEPEDAEDEDAEPEDAEVETPEADAEVDADPDGRVD
jgi:preprotein translocase subunit YajC